MKQVTTIPNKPELMVAVRFYRTMQQHFGPKAGQKIVIPLTFVGSSACEVSVEKHGTPEAQKLPIVWRFIAGQKCGGDSLEDDPAWSERRVEVPAKVKDAAKYMQEHEFQGSDFRWYLMEPEEPTWSK